MDLHSHLLPGLDDGVQSMEESLDMIRRLASLGYRHLVTTPHVIWDCYRNTPEGILASVETVRAACREAGLSVTIDAAAEYFLDEHFSDMLRNEEPLLTLGEKRVLVELPYTTQLMNVSETLFSIVERGYRPVLAHPERYAYYHADPEAYRRFTTQGVELQLNALSLTGHYGDEVAKAAEWLLRENLIAYLGTDAHRMSHLDGLNKLSRSKWLGAYKFHNERLLPSKEIA